MYFCYIIRFMIGLIVTPMSSGVECGNWISISFFELVIEKQSTH